MNTSHNYTSRQLKLPLQIENLIDISDPVYTFCDVMDHIDLSRYFVEKDYKTGRPRCDSQKLLRVILFAFMECGIQSLRSLEKLCRTDIRFMYLLDDMKAPSHTTFKNFINQELSDNITNIFADINKYIFEKDNVDLTHTYIDGTKIEANANKYSWVWKKSCLTNRKKLFEKVSLLLDEINQQTFSMFEVTIEKREEYAIEYLENILVTFQRLTKLDTSKFVYGIGHRKSLHQKQYQKLQEYIDRLKKYAKHIEICGDSRNSYSKTDRDATFMRIKTDYMGNDQLLPAYNMQIAICDEYIAVVDAKQYAADMDCFVPLMEKFNSIYGHYPKYPVADAGYGSYNNYLYCEENGMEKFMKFPMFNRETKDAKYTNDPYRINNFKRDEEGYLICPNNKRFYHKYDRAIRGNKYGRTEEIFECEDCTNCPFSSSCRKNPTRNRVARLNQELTAFHQEVVDNLESVHGALLRMNRSIQSEGTFGSIKWNRSYKRLFRRGEKSVILEFTLISCGYNLYKYHNKRNRMPLAA